MTNIYISHIIHIDNHLCEVFQMDERETALIFKAFCDENRIRILNILKDGEKCACRLLEALSVTQPTLSHHMKILCDAGVVSGRKEGKWMYYSISEEGLAKAQEYINFLMLKKEENKNE